MKFIGNKALLVAMIAISLITGAIGATVIRAGQVNAQTPATTPAAVTAPSPGSDVDKQMHQGTFQPNEDPAHEAKESPEREAQEDAGKFPTVR